jgi:hypothetical protein
MEIDMLDFAETHASLKRRQTPDLVSLVLTCAQSKTPDNVVTVHAGMLVLFDRMPRRAYNDLWAELEDLGFAAGDEADVEEDYLEDFNSVGSRHHY